MPLVVIPLSKDDSAAVASLWQAANDARRLAAGLEQIRDSGDVLSRPGIFAVGVIEAGDLLSIAVGMPALADDGRSVHNVPGLAHISSVATLPSHWRRGLGTRALQAVMAQASRRGYARVQLFTHVANPAARRLYEHQGFYETGRRRLDATGEQLMHYVCDLPPVPWVARPAARILCLDPGDRILLMHWRDPVDGFQLWEPPGGGVEAGETSYDAAVREWREETGLPLPRLDETPTAVAREVLFNGFRSIVDEDFYLGRSLAAGEPTPDEATAAEQDAYLGHRWVPWQDLAALEDPVEPDLLPVLRRLAPEGPWRADRPGE